MAKQATAIITNKQHKLLELLIDWYGNPNSNKTLGELILEAGYSKASSINPRLILEGKAIQDGLQEIVESMEEKRMMALNSITPRKLSKSSAKDGATIADIMTKNIQLLSGKETERVGVSLASLFNRSKEKQNG